MTSEDGPVVVQHHDEAAAAAAAVGPHNRRTSVDYGFDSTDPRFTSDEFRMYEMKVKRCPISKSHDWTTCIWAHPGEKAKRRDPRKFSYSGTACVEYRKSGICARGDACTFSHGVFECWLHPNRYRTQLCTDGMNCRRRVCFFAHQECDLRRLPGADPNLPPVGAAPSAQLQADLAAEATLLQSQAQLAQALHSYLEHSKARQEEAVTAAAQMLDPLAKLRLLQTLQQQQAAAVLGGSGADSVDVTLLAALQGLAVSGIVAPAPQPASMARHSMDGGYLPPVSAPLPPPYSGPSGQISRRSVDIGSLSRVTPRTSGALPFLGTVPHRLEDLIPGVAMVAGVGGSGRHIPVPGTLFGPLPTSSFMSVSTGLMGSPATGAGMTSMEALSPTANNNCKAGAAGGGGGAGAEHPTTQPSLGLDSIDELGPADEDSSSGSSAAVRSVSAGSSLDIGNGKDAVVAALNASAPVVTALRAVKPTRAMSFENILAELPRSSSQVDMLGII